MYLHKAGFTLGKRYFALEQAMKAQRGSRGMAVLFLEPQC
jgi:hypothetical protein